MFDTRIQNEQTDHLIKAIVSISDEDEAYRFFEDLCTIAELKSLAQRLAVASMLRKKVTYQEIAQITGASTATISRVNRALSYGADGYHRILDKMEGGNDASDPEKASN